MRTLIIKLNATGDVVRTTTLLHRIPGEVTWITHSMNVELLEGVMPRVQVLTWEERDRARSQQYDMAINLEDEIETASFLSQITHAQRYGAYLNGRDTITYTDNSSLWFDLSLISVHGRRRADELKLVNRRTYQDLLFAGLGWQFEGEPYLLPAPVPTGLTGDIAIAPVAGPVWPMKGWAYYDELKARLEGAGYVVNVLPRRQTLREHMGDVSGHRCLVSGDSLPMHLALATSTRCVTLFNCTSPWEIHDYGLQIKIISPELERFFYQRGNNEVATKAITLDAVYAAVVQQLNASTRPS